ncbi:hypothetical protein GCM10007390_31620 [Persicitalea jodogahamensis]|uniref:Uncharacterized protein n=1 Tax=Persicitalea jodogahamensis TaxID=402147 RepID=A0A8J3D894_9BACT|nr:hypothetical protein GCM10007390_31620 [Persicitalea jodogahamensis]
MSSANFDPSNQLTKAAMNNRLKFLSGLAFAVLCLACHPGLHRATYQTDPGSWKYPLSRGFDTEVHTVTRHTVLPGDWSLSLITVMNPKPVVINYEEGVNLYVWATCGHTWRLPPTLMQINPPIAQIAG